jgi:hypothetical protein
MSGDGYYGIRVTYRGHETHTVQTCAHRSTADNLRACIRALAALESVTDEQMVVIFQRTDEPPKIERYRSYGAA